jgi:hypothetical protein
MYIKIGKKEKTIKNKGNRKMIRRHGNLEWEVTTRYGCGCRRRNIVANRNQHNGYSFDFLRAFERQARNQDCPRCELERIVS